MRHVRRRAIVLGGAAVTLALVSGVVLTQRREQEAARARAADAARSAYVALRTGDLRRASTLAIEARALDPAGREPAMAWLHTTGLQLIDGDGSARDGVALLEQARVLGATGTDLAFAVLAAAIGTRNDKLAMRLFDEHQGRGVVPDAFYELAAGAALDLACDERAAEHYAASAALWVDALLPRVRRARAFILADDFEAAREALAAIPSGRPEAQILSAVIDRLEATSAKPAYVDPFAATDLPRSVRALAQALTVGAETATAGIDVALDDADTPLVAVLCGRIALRDGDVTGAASAADAALRMRPELGAATRLAVSAALARGDLESAQRAIEGGNDAESTHLVRAVVAYAEARPADVRDEAEDAFHADVAPWSLATAARGVLGDGRFPVSADLERFVAKREPWAEELLVDAALSRGVVDPAEVDRLVTLARTAVARWHDPSPQRKQRIEALRKRDAAPPPP